MHTFSRWGGCLPKTAIATLEAIRLFLFVERTAFVIGADELMIEYAVREHFPDLPPSSGPISYARNYLEKLIQVPDTRAWRGRDAGLCHAALPGAPATGVFIALMEFVSPPGGAVDEAIADQAMLEAIGDLAEAGLESFDRLTPQQMHDFFLDFIARSIKGRVTADLGSRGITLSNDVAAVENAQIQLHDFVTGATRGELAGKLDNLERLSDRDVQVVVDQIYETGSSSSPQLGKPQHEASHDH
ncbi:Qat anti-phage system associated protein QatB [Bradyrhizobium liaoningense]